MSPILPFAVRHEGSGGRHVLALSGELDMAAAPQLEAILAELSADSVSALTVDMSGLTFMDSTGLHAVLNARAICASQGSDFVLIAGPPRIQRLFEITGLLDVIAFESDGAPAHERLSSHQRAATAVPPGRFRSREYTRDS